MGIEGARPRGRPLRERPADFDTIFEELGWEGTPAYYGTTPRVVHRWSKEGDYETLKRRRHNYVMGLRLSTVKRTRRMV